MPIRRSTRFLGAAILTGHITAGTCADDPAIVPGPPPLQAAAQQSVPQRTAAAQALLQKYYKGLYSEVGAEGLILLKEEPDNRELRYFVANSLAWTGFGSDALAQYEMLNGTDFHGQARLGWANVHRWNGRPDLAANAYQEILSKEPDNKDAAQGLLLARRELRPRSAFQLGRAGNSSDTWRSAAVVSHRWRPGSNASSFELSAGKIEENRQQLRVQQRDLALRYENPDLWLAPQLEVNAQEAPDANLFGTATLKIADMPAYLTVGRINWGKLAFDPRALRDRLAANQIGVQARNRGHLGELSIAYNVYRVSDGNLIRGAQVRYTPSLQPFLPVRIYLGAEGRKARFEDPRYWSPHDGHYTGFAGLGTDYGNEQWQLYGSVQYGRTLNGVSGNSWSASFGAKRWIGEDWAASTDIWSINTPRDGGYKSTSATLRLERLW